MKEMICPICNVPKLEGAFYTKRRKRKDGTLYEYRESTCKSCVEAARYKRRKANPEAYKRLLERGRKKSKRKYQENPQASHERVKRWVNRKIDSGSFKNTWLQSKYGITLDDLNVMREAQNYSCSICRKTEEELGYVLHVDHCHNTGQVRGLLCVGCNTVLGKIEKLGGTKHFEEYLSLFKTTAQP